MDSVFQNIKDIIKSFGVDNTITFITVILGTMASIFTTVYVDKLRTIRDYQKESLESKLIPYCKSIEQAIRSIDGRMMIDNKELIDSIKVPTKYLDVENRICLSKQQRRLLSDYKEQLDVFLDQLEKDKEKFIVKYNEWITNRLKEIDCLSFKPLFVTITPSISQMDIERIIINKYAYSLVGTVESIVFYESNSTIECRKHYFKLLEHIKRVEHDVTTGLKPIYELSEEDLADYHVYRYLISLDDERVVQSILEETSTYDQLYKLKKKANRIFSKLIKQIDKIRGN